MPLSLAEEHPTLPLVGLWEPLAANRFDGDEASAEHFFLLLLDSVMMSEQCHFVKPLMSKR
jgi:hypothetical protein